MSQQCNITNLEIASLYEIDKKSRLVEHGGELDMETHITMIGKMGLLQPSATLKMPNAFRIGQNSDHRGIIRFLSLQSRFLHPVLQSLEYSQPNIEARANLQGAEGGFN